MARSASPTTALSWRFWLLAGYLAAVFLLGGGARGDIQSLVLLRPLAALVTGVALLTLRSEDLARHRFLAVFAGATVLWVAVQLVPLPPALWQSLPGRGLIARIDAAAGLGDLWRPFTIDPQGTTNALAALLVPLPVLLLAVQLDGREQRALVPLVLAIGLVGVMVAVVQISSRALYFYRVTNPGAGVGLFANRNHQAAFLAALFPLVALFARGPRRARRDGEDGRLRIAAAAAMALVLVPLILVTGSRAGLVLAGPALIAAALIWRSGAPPRRAGTPRRSNVVVLASALAGVLVVAVLGVVFARAEAVTRLFASDQTDDLRLKVWGPVLRLGLEYLALGSGSGSFVTAFKVAEPDALVRATYLNHAHNDFLEVLLTDGVAGAAFVVAASAWLALRSARAWLGSAAVQADAALGRTASAALAVLWLASAVDYPLRVPALAALAALAAVWLSSGTRLRPTNAVEV